VQVLRYEALLHQLTRTSEPADTASELMTMNEASVGMVNSIVRTRIPNESVLRAFDEEDI
jgi:hypothetical protein